MAMAIDLGVIGKGCLVEYTKYLYSACNDSKEFSFCFARKKLSDTTVQCRSTLNSSSQKVLFLFTQQCL